jgi:hypothetical protein
MCAHVLRSLRLTACTTSRLLPGLPPVCAGNARTDLPEKLHWLLGAHGTLHDLLLFAASMAWLATPNQGALLLLARKRHNMIL